MLSGTCIPPITTLSVIPAAEGKPSASEGVSRQTIYVVNVERPSRDPLTLSACREGTVWSPNLQPSLPNQYLDGPNGYRITFGFRHDGEFRVQG